MGLLQRAFLATFMCAAAVPAAGVPSGINADSLTYLGRVNLADDWSEVAIGCFRRALLLDPGNGRAATGVGEAHLKMGAVDSARYWFEIARELDPDSGYYYYGLGLIALSERRGPQAERYFRTALYQNENFADALLELGVEQSRTMLGVFFARGTIEEAIALEPRHPRAHYELGRLQEEYARDYETAVRSYLRQIILNPQHADALSRLSRILIDNGRASQARDVIAHGLRHTRGVDESMAFMLAETYLRERDFDQADQYYRQALALLPENERSVYQDITLLARPDEVEEFEHPQGAERDEFVRRFWWRMDPLPATPINERKLEHYRRVRYSCEHFAEFRKPFDDRGEVYVRYGHADHVTSSRRRSLASDPDVLRVRQRRLRQVYGVGMMPARTEDMLTGELPVFPQTDPFLPNTIPGVDARVSRGLDEFDMERHIETGDQSTSMSVQWEEWTYVNVGGGCVITFTDVSNNGDFTLSTSRASPFTGGLDFALHVADLSPLYEMDERRREEPDRYQYSKGEPPLGLHYFLAQFRTDAPETTQINIFSSVPLRELGATGSDSGRPSCMHVEHGLAVFDENGGLVTRDLRTSTIAIPSGLSLAGLVDVDRASTALPAGSRTEIAVQVRDPATGRAGADRKQIEVERFDGLRLAMSDVVLADSIRPAVENDDARFVIRGATVFPAPTLAFRKGASMWVYFETYGLRRGEEYGERRYEVTHTVEHRGSKGIWDRVRGLLGSGSEEIAVVRTVVTIHETEQQYFRLDTSGLRTGENVLTVTIHDLHADAEVSRRREFVILE